jgi:hypothetical protein
MSNEVINTVKVQAAAGRSDELGKQLQKFVRAACGGLHLNGIDHFVGHCSHS